MPLAFILVAMISLFYGSISAFDNEKKEEATLQSEADAIAGNMIAYRAMIGDYAKFRNSIGQMVNYNRYLSFVGDAQTFIDTTPAGFRPSTRAWFSRIPGVNGHIENGTLYLFYTPPPDGTGVTTAGVQAALLRATQNSNRIGKVFHENPLGTANGGSGPGTQ